MNSPKPFIVEYNECEVDEDFDALEPDAFDDIMDDLVDGD